MFYTSVSMCSGNFTIVVMISHPVDAFNGT